ncbi:MAG TPA: hypothetical protein VGC48_04590 [Gemmatimonadales bacterium]
MTARQVLSKPTSQPSSESGGTPDARACSAAGESPTFRSRTSSPISRR